MPQECLHLATGDPIKAKVQRTIAAAHYGSRTGVLESARQGITIERNRPIAAIVPLGDEGSQAAGSIDHAFHLPYLTLESLHLHLQRMLLTLSFFQVAPGIAQFGGGTVLLFALLDNV